MNVLYFMIRIEKKHLIFIKDFAGFTHIGKYRFKWEGKTTEVERGYRFIVSDVPCPSCSIKIV